MNEDEIVGKTVVVGVSYYDENDILLDQKQFHGRIVGINQEIGIRYVDVETHTERVLPPRRDALFPAPKGWYREYTAKKVINDPDFISIWHVKRKAGENDNWEWTPYRLDWARKDAEAENK